jgi:hypothetical protein
MEIEKSIEKLVDEGFENHMGDGGAYCLRVMVNNLLRVL